MLMFLVVISYHCTEQLSNLVIFLLLHITTWVFGVLREHLLSPCNKVNVGVIPIAIGTAN